jgi:hypothetical protein
VDVSTIHCHYSFASAVQLLHLYKAISFNRITLNGCMLTRMRQRKVGKTSALQELLIGSPFTSASQSFPPSSASPPSTLKTSNSVGSA